jgi:polysaccharide biosynthesis transport protein
MEIRDFLTPLIRWWWLLIVSTLIAGIFSLIAVKQQPPLYSTSATLLVGSALTDPNPQYDKIYYTSELISTYVDIAYRSPVQEAAQQALGVDWLPQYIVSQVPNTQLIEVTATDQDPVMAQAAANEIANQLILQSPGNRNQDKTRQQFIEDELDQIQNAIRETQSEVDAKQKEMTTLSSARQITELQNQIGALQNKLLTLRANYTNLLSNSQSGALNTLTLIEPAKLPAYPVGPSDFIPVATASALAFFIAAGAAYLLAYLDQTVKSSDEVKRITGLPVLAGIPPIPGESYAEKLITVNQPRSPIAEAFRSLRTGVQFSTIDRTENTAIMVTSPSPSEGKSVTTANLAAVIAQAGHRVLVIDADLRRPVLHRVFGVDNRIGLTEFLRFLHPNDLEETIIALLHQLARPTKIEGLSILTSGPIPPNPSELLGSRTHNRLLAVLKNHYDFVLLDSPPVLIVTDAVVLSTQIDGTILVIDAVGTQKNPLRLAAERLREVNANILGVVVNRVSPRTDGYGAYYQYQYTQKGGIGPYGFAGETQPTAPKTRLRNKPIERSQK